ncbi:ATP-binding protein [Actinophytocola gossypii]|uniref:ATP-binding protein n=1 Tax=Actinophytocola gossypii TaxID=2812003 RepID=UPI00288324DD|nr:ATP-binding protein [Actinophytocola gossypii]
MTTKRRGMTEEAADAAIDQACRMLRMPTIRNSFTDYADRARREQMSYRGFLAELLLAECDDRARRRSERRIKAAKVPPREVPAGLRLRRQPQHRSRRDPHPRQVRMGPEGTAAVSDRGLRHRQVHLLIALGTEAAMAGYRVKYTLATQLANELVEAADEMTLAKTIARYGRVDLLCIDELGYMQLDRRGAELLFQVLTEREEKASVAIASNESFGGWTKTFTDPRLCAAIVDRLTFGGTILETGTDSYRLAQATKQRTT